MNRKCNVEVQGDKRKIGRANANTREMRVKISHPESLDNGIWELSDDDYIGRSEGLLVKRDLRSW